MRQRFPELIGTFRHLAFALIDIALDVGSIGFKPHFGWASQFKFTGIIEALGEACKREVILVKVALGQKVILGIL